jgi:hypothetical protein
MLRDYHVVTIILIVLIIILGLLWDPIKRWSKKAYKLIGSIGSRTTPKISKPVTHSILKMTDDKDLLKDVTKLWVQHFLYTRLAVEAFFSNSAELDTIITRLMKNQQDIGNAFGDVYGSGVGATIASELTTHIQIAVELLKAIKSKNNANIQEVTKRFYDNAQTIGNYLDILTQSDGTFHHHLKMHIDTLLANVGAYVHKEYSKDIVTLDKYFDAGIDMAFDMV